MYISGANDYNRIGLFYSETYVFALITQTSQTNFVLKRQILHSLIFHTFHHQLAAQICTRGMCSYFAASQGHRLRGTYGNMVIAELWSPAQKHPCKLCIHVPLQL
mmetsp:Transcript_11941/g.15618  ORF Transcript_11941/g.15618 Transcript_11941/m.15618 type:complete len:105 (+) Transcript_11941:203-517(+)